MRMISDIHTHTHTQFPPLLVLALQKPAIKKLSHKHTHRESLLGSGKRVTRCVCTLSVFSWSTLISDLTIHYFSQFSHTLFLDIELLLFLLKFSLQLDNTFIL